MAGVKLCITILLFFNITSKHLLFANPLDHRHISGNWSEIVVSKHVFDDKGELIGEPEIQVFINPRKCTFIFGKFIRLPCMNNEYQRPELQQQNPSTSKPLMETYHVITPIKQNRTFKTFKYDLPSIPKSDDYIVEQNSVIKPPRIECPQGQKIDIFDNCRDVW